MTGDSLTALRLSGLDSLEVRDLAFVGTPGLPTDARITLDFDRIAQATVYHCEFYGLRTDAHGGAIISAARSRLRVEQSMFLGSFGYSALYVPVIQNLEWEDIYVTTTIFADYGQRPGFHGKTQGATFSWVTVGDPASPTPLSPRREVVIRDVIFDEGAMFGLFSQPERYRAPSPAVDLIHISDLFQNVSNLGTAGTLIYDARRVLIERTHYGYSRYTSGAVDLRGVGAAIIDRVECVDAADLIRADAATGQLSVVNSVYRDVLSQASLTRLLPSVADADDPVWYVRREYEAALGREPQPAEHFYWSQRLLECVDATGGGAGAAECVRTTRAALAAYLAARPAPTFALAGKVTDAGGAALSGVSVTLWTGGQPLVATRTDASGEYRFAALPTGGEYRVEAAADYYQMEPAAHTLVTPTGDRRADFAAKARTFALRGRVVTTNNYGFAGVRVTLAGGATAETVTDAEGYFAFTGLAALRSYTVTPLLAHHTFEAAAQTIGS
ncbi:MAG TPA: carboxypeptidase-like regulatory domain-containing protein, partial [Pyrinomonadaceae bacterium]